jgi:hypothetical protein
MQNIINSEYVLPESTGISVNICPFCNAALILNPYAQENNEYAYECDLQYKIRYNAVVRGTCLTVLHECKYNFDIGVIE